MNEPKKKGKQFDLSHLQVDERLQGAKLASFPKRSMAFALDWFLISLATQYFALGVVILLAYLFMKRKAMQTFRQGRSFIDQLVDRMDASLERFNTQHQLRRQFVRYSRIYIHTLIIIVFVASVAMVVISIIELSHPAHLRESASKSTVNLLAVPFEGVYNGIRIFGSAVGGLLYFSLFTWKWHGQTPGKRLMGIRVVKMNSKPISLWNSFERVSGYASSASLLLMGFFQCLWDRNHQTTHDKICESVVIIDNPIFAVNPKKLPKKEAEETTVGNAV